MHWDESDIEKIATQLEKYYHDYYLSNIKLKDLKEMIIDLDIEIPEEISKSSLEEILEKWGEIRDENYEEYDE